jgi:AcrR family transcriptional regulator
MPAKKRAISPRKSPNQTRAKETVDAILRATAHILRKEGYARATTNRIAEKAGVSIGSLYQYFPSREAIVNALLERHASEIQLQLASVLEGAVDQPLAVIVERFIAAMIALHSKDPELHRAFSEQLPTLGGISRLREVMSPGTQMVRAYLGMNAHRLRKMDLDVATFVLVNAVEAVTHGYALGEAALDPSALVREVTTLVLRYLEP